MIATLAGAAAHADGIVAPGELWTAWSAHPLPTLLLAALAILHERGLRRLRRRSREGRPGARRAWCFRTALAALAAALLSPLEALAAGLFAAHMVQHLLLILVAAPLLVVARPTAALVWGLPTGVRRALRRSGLLRTASSAGGALASPAAAWTLAGAALWAWHAPALYGLALERPGVHVLEHATLLGTSILFWWAAVGPGRRGRLGRGGAVLFVFTAALHTGFLGGLLTFSPEAWYPGQSAAAAAWGLTPLEDQQLAGLLMWIPMGLVYAGTALHSLVTWLRDLDAGRAGSAAAGLLVGLLVAACGGGDAPEPTRSVAGGEPETGRELVRSLGCGSCHTIEGLRDARGVVGPPLTGFARRKMIAGTVPNRTGNLVRWIEDPPSIQPGTAMPNLGVSPLQARHIAAYLYTLD